MEVPSLSWYSCSCQAEHTSQRSLDSKLKQGHRSCWQTWGDSAQKLCLELGQVNRQPGIRTGPQTIDSGALSSVRQQQGKPNTDNIDYSNDLLCVCLLAAHKSPNVLLKTVSHPANSQTSVQQDVRFCSRLLHLQERD